MFMNLSISQIFICFYPLMDLVLLCIFCLDSWRVILHVNQIAVCKNDGGERIETIKKQIGYFHIYSIFFNGFFSVPLLFWTIVYIIVEVVTGMQRLLEAKRTLNDQCLVGRKGSRPDVSANAVRCRKKTGFYSSSFFLYCC